MWYIVFAFARDIDELKDERPPRDDAAASREEITANNIFKH